MRLVGGVLLGWLLGPGLGGLTMATVLLIQAVALGDGGVAALGADIVNNMALLPAVLVTVAKRFSAPGEHLRPALPAVSIVAGLSMPLAALLIVGETAIFRPAAELNGWMNFAAMMLGTHLGVGLFEGALTAVLLMAADPADITCFACLRLAACTSLPGSRAGAGRIALANLVGVARWL